MSEVVLRDVRKSFDTVEIIHGVSLSVHDGEFVVFVGPSGCGKTTTLRLIAGFEEPDSGEIRIDGRVVNDLEPRDRGLGMVFQSHALFPHKTLFENMAFGLRLRKTPEDEIRRRVMDAAKLLRIDGMLDRRPAALSGGQRQRVAIGRAIVREPKVFLFDEPLSNLDAQLRNEMRSEIKRLHQRLGATIIYVTHDQVEAMTLADRIAVLSGGHRMQYDTPDAIYHRPATTFVAGFIGAPPMNLVDCRLDGDAGDLGGGVRVPLASRSLAGAARGAALKLGVRPENLRLARAGADIALPAAVCLLEPLGAEVLVTLKLGAAEVVARCPAAFREPPGTPVTLYVDPSHVALFDAASGTALSAPSAH